VAGQGKPAATASHRSSNLGHDRASASSPQPADQTEDTGAGRCLRHPRSRVRARRRVRLCREAALHPGNGHRASRLPADAGCDRPRAGTSGCSCSRLPGRARCRPGWCGANLVLACAEGAANYAIAKRFGVTNATVGKWRSSASSNDFVCASTGQNTRTRRLTPRRCPRRVPSVVPKTHKCGMVRRASNMIPRQVGTGRDLEGIAKSLIAKVFRLVERSQIVPLVKRIVNDI
jgi:hypothetical protein